MRGHGGPAAAVAARFSQNGLAQIEELQGAYRVAADEFHSAKLPCTPHSDDLNDVAELAPPFRRKSTASIRPKPAPKYDHGVEIYSAGGVGGLLSTTQISQSPISNVTYVPTYDGNGNVSEYLDASGSITAHFEYDPFGNTVVNTDTGNQFSYRFSTKPLDFATGLYYYGYRWYDPVTGRWPSRDPIGEKGGVNLYGFVRNDVLDEIDVLGLVIQSIQVGNDPGNANDIIEKSYQKQLVDQSNVNAANFEKMINSMSDDDFKKITKNGITIMLYIDEAGKTLKEPKKIIVYASKQEVLKWAGYEKTSSHIFIQESNKLTLGDIETKARNLKGNEEYAYDSFGLVIHGLPGRGVRLSANHRDTHVNAKKIVDAVKFFEFKALISCGIPPWEEYVSAYLTEFSADGWDVKKCAPSITPAQIGFDLEGKNPPPHE